jgi:hypothetical protein
MFAKDLIEGQRVTSRRPYMLGLADAQLGAATTTNDSVAKINLTV